MNVFSRPCVVLMVVQGSSLNCLSSRAQRRSHSQQVDRAEEEAQQFTTNQQETLSHLSQSLPGVIHSMLVLIHQHCQPTAYKREL